MNIELKPNNVPTKPGWYCMRISQASTANRLFAVFFKEELTIQLDDELIPVDELPSHCLWSDALTFSVSTGRRKNE